MLKLISGWLEPHRKLGAYIKPISFIVGHISLKDAAGYEFFYLKSNQFMLYDFIASCIFIDILLYYTEAFLPFLQIFFGEFYLRGHEDQSEFEGHTIGKIYSSLLVC